jgi:hypothetical protein
MKESKKASKHKELQDFFFIQSSSKDNALSFFVCVCVIASGGARKNQTAQREVVFAQEVIEERKRDSWGKVFVTNEIPIAL